MSDFRNFNAYQLASNLITAAKNHKSGYNFTTLDLKNIWRHLCVEGINAKSTDYGLGQRIGSSGKFKRYSTGDQVLDTILTIDLSHPGLLGAKSLREYGQILEFSPHGSYKGSKSLSERKNYANLYGSTSYKTMDGIFELALLDSDIKNIQPEKGVVTYNFPEPVVNSIAPAVSTYVDNPEKLKLSLTPNLSKNKIGGTMRLIKKFKK